MSETLEDAETMRCPTCRAVQVWSDACRRCKCDLRLLWEITERAATLKSSSLSNLRQGNYAEALRNARELHDLLTDEESRRLLAVCELLNGNLCSAKWLAQQAVRESGELSDDEVLTTE